jgi:hypothetical protein
MEQRRPFAPAAAPLKAGSAQMKDCGRCQRSLPMSGFLMQIKELSASNLFYCLDVKLTEEFMDKLVLGVAALALSVPRRPRATAMVMATVTQGHRSTTSRLRDMATQRQPTQHRPPQRPLLS